MKRWYATGIDITYDGTPIAQGATPEDTSTIVLAHNRAVDSINGVEWSSYHGCFTGTCPHEHADDCLSAIRQYHEGLGRMVLDL